MASQSRQVEQAFALARERYAEQEVDVEEALRRLAGIAISLHCWQGDDVGGFESTGAELGGGLAVTGYVEHALDSQPLGIMFSERDKDLQAAVARELKALKQDQSFIKLLDNWFGR